MRQVASLRSKTDGLAQLGFNFVKFVPEILLAEQRRGNCRSGDLSRIDIAAKMGAGNKATMAVVLNPLVNFLFFLGKHFGKYQSDNRTIGSMPRRIRRRIAIA